MKKQLRIVTRFRLSVCPFSSGLYPVPRVPRLVFGKHLRRLPVCFRPLPGVSVRPLASGWFVWSFRSGRRQLSAFPF